MDVGEVREITRGACRDLAMIETGMFDVTGYGAIYVIDAERPAIVETGIGTTSEHLLAAIEGHGIDPDDVAAICTTHVHLDHAGGAGHFAAACENATVFVHEIGAPHLVEPADLIAGTKRAVGDQWRHYVEPEPVPEDRVEALTDGDRVDLGDHELVARHAPGHAPHQVIFHVPTMDAVFTGDAAGLWIPSLGRVHQSSPPPNFRLDQAVADLDAIADCTPKTLLYTHFGPRAFEGSLLDRYERILAEWVRDVDAARSALGDDDAVVERFVDRTGLDRVWGAEKAAAETEINVRGVLHYLDHIRTQEE